MAIKIKKSSLIKALSEPGENWQVLWEQAEAVYKNDRGVVMKAINTRGDYRFRGRALSDASEDLRNDKEVVLTAIAQNGYVLQYASDALKNDFDFMVDVIKTNEDALGFAPSDMQEKLKPYISAS